MVVVIDEAYLVLVAIASFLAGIALGWILMELYFTRIAVELKRKRKG